MRLGLFAMAATAASFAAPAMAAPPLPLTSLDRPALARKVAVFGSDDRRVLPERQRPDLASSIGVLYDRRLGGICTAFCVAADIVATAAHCLFGTPGEPPPDLADFRFRMRLDKPAGEASIAGARQGAAAQNVVAGSTALSIRPPIDATRDWALARLDRRACTGRILPIETRPTDELIALSRLGLIYQAAYHKDFGDWKLVEGGACPLARDYDAASWPAIARDFEDADRLVLHTCDTGGASSGSPLLIDGPNGPTVVAINVGTYVQSRVLMQDGVVVHRYAADNVANTAVNALSFQASLAAMRDAGVTASRAQLRDLQAALRRHGYYDGPLDGVYDRAMRTAIEAFEREARMPVTGLATRSLRAQLEGYKGPGAKLRAATGQRPETAGETLAADAR